MLASAGAAAGNAAVVKAQQPKTPTAAVPLVLPQQASGPAVYKNLGERLEWLRAHQEEYAALSRAKKAQLDALPFPVTSKQLDDKLTELKAPTAPKLSSSLPRAGWAVQAGLSSTSRQAGTLGMDSIGETGGANMHLTLYKDSNQTLDVSLGFGQLFANVLREGSNPPLHVTVELYGRDARTNPRAYGTATGQAWTQNVTAAAAQRLGRPGERARVDEELKDEVKAQVSILRDALRPKFAARGGTLP